MRTILFILVCFIALTAIPSGLMMISSPDGILLKLDPGLLKSTPFKNFMAPGILLTILVGVTNLLAVISNMMRHHSRYNWALAGGIMISGWTIVQMILINTVSWLHFIYLGAGIIIVLMAFQLKGKPLI